MYTDNYTDFCIGTNFSDDFPNILIHLDQGDSLKEVIKQKINTSKYLGSNYNNSSFNNYEIESLKVSGKLDGEDLIEIRRICGSIGYNTISGNTIELLDLSEAHIIEDEIYFSNPYSAAKYKTQKNVIGSYMFLRCHLLKRLILPIETIVVEDFNVFKDCNTLSDIFITKNVSDFGAVTYLESLECYSVDSENNELMSVDGSLFSKDGKTLIHIPRSQNVCMVQIPRDVERISKSCFWKHDNLYTIELNENVKYIGEFNFSGKSLNKITLPEKNEFIKIIDNLLINMTNGKLITTLKCKIEELIIPEFVSSINYDAFSSTNQIENIIFKYKLKSYHPFVIDGRNISSISFNIYDRLLLQTLIISDEVRKTCTIKVPKETKNEYVQKLQWDTERIHEI